MTNLMELVKDGIQTVWPTVQIGQRLRNWRTRRRSFLVSTVACSGGAGSDDGRDELERVGIRREISFNHVGGHLAATMPESVLVRVDLQRVIDTAQLTTELIRVLFQRVREPRPDLGMLADGMTQMEIAAELRLTVKSVERCLAHIRDRVRRNTARKAVAA